MPRTLLVALLLGVLPGCSSQPSPRPPQASPAPSRQASADARPRDAGWGRLRIVSRSLELELPELSEWQYRAGKNWVRVSHAPSDSTLELWVVRAERLARPSDCEARARLERSDLWSPSPETTVDRQTLDRPPGFRTELAVGISAEPGRTQVMGHLVAFGSSPGRCLAIHFTTRVEGQNAEEEVARRLNLIATGAVPSLTLRGVEDRVGKPAER